MLDSHSHAVAERRLAEFGQYDPLLRSALGYDNLRLQNDMEACTERANEIMEPDRIRSLMRSLRKQLSRDDYYRFRGALVVCCIAVQAEVYGSRPVPKILEQIVIRIMSDWKIDPADWRRRFGAS